MALGGGSQRVTGNLRWTRGEFSDGSRTKIYEGVTSSFASATQVGDIPSSTISMAFPKDVSFNTSFTRWYWVRHVLASGTEGVLVGPVSALYDGGV